MKLLLHFIGVFCTCALLSFEAFAQSSPLSTANTRPNILLIVADDLGYGDLGVYGGDIRTPNIDSLAGEGMLFTQFHTAPVCAVTRSMLLTGNNNHVAGVAQQGAPESFLSDRVAPMPRLLREAGYHTYSSGKWHLGNAEEHSPLAAGFERSYNLVHGAANHYNSVGFFEGGSLYREDGKETQYPEGTYTTELFTDTLIDYMESNRSDGDPFFVLAAYTSPHWPLQVPEAYLDRYSGAYDMGYDVLREMRFESLKNAGIIPETSTLPPRNDAITPWVDLSAEEKRIESRKMELYAAMVENLDDNVGRLLEYLKSNGLYDNTLIVFMSDNGAAAEDFYHNGQYAPFIQANYDNSYENMGKPNSFVSYGPQWAEAGSAPFSRYKGYTREGGIVAPMIIAGAGVQSAGIIDNSYITVMDLAPTILELAGAQYPTDGSVRPMLGESINGLLSGVALTVHEADYVTTFYHNERAYVRQGDWKIVNLERPFDESQFGLFNVATDPGETTDLATVEPEKYAEMLQLWRVQRVDLGITLPGEQ